MPIWRTHLKLLCKMVHMYNIFEAFWMMPKSIFSQFWTRNNQKLSQTGKTIKKQWIFIGKSFGFCQVPKWTIFNQNHDFVKIRPPKTWAWLQEYQHFASTCLFCHFWTFLMIWCVWRTPKNRSCSQASKCIKGITDLKDFIFRFLWFLDIFRCCVIKKNNFWKALENGSKTLEIHWFPGGRTLFFSQFS